MAHGTNFVDDRLRLVAFLRVVGHGMPHRPLRFKRRDQDIDEQARNFHYQPYTKRDNTLRKRHASTSVGLTTPSSPITTTNAAQEEPYQIDSPVYMDPVYALPLSPTSAQLCNDLEHNDAYTGSGARNRAQQHPSPSRDLKRFGVTKSPSGTKGAGLMINGPSRIKKRRLPVHQLALLRAPTYDGLPQPVTTRESTVVVSTVNCSTKKGHVPIPATHIEVVHRSDREVTSQHVPSPCQGPDVCPSDLKSTRTAAQARNLKSRLLALQPKAHHNSKAASDGYVGSELSINSVHMSARRKGPICKRSKKCQSMRGLALQRGPAPMAMGVAAVSTTELSVAQEQAQSSVIVGSYGVLASREPRCQTVSTQFLLSQDQGATLGAPQPYPPRQLEMIITNKLASVSAPRRRSESSGSRSTAGPYSFDDEDECDDDEYATVSAGSLGDLERVRSPVDDISQSKIVD